MASDVRGAASPVGEVVGAMLEGQVVAQADANKRMLATWLLANGDRERAHTVGVYLKEPQREGALPVLVVYVDSSACVVDFRSQREVYLARMQAAGVSLQAVEVRLSKYAGQRRAARAPASDERVEAPSSRDAAEGLSGAEERQVLRMTAKLPDNLQKAAYKAISASLLRDKREQSRKD